MMSLDERLDKAEEMIQKPSFRENKGLGNEVGYYIFDYPAEKELYIRERIEYIKKKSENSDDDFKVVVFDLYDIMIDILIKKGYLEKCYQFEKTKGFERVSKSISNMLRITSSDSLIVNHIRDNTPEKAVVFITGIGKCYPILRSHTVLNNLHQVIDNVPVVLFYPGNYDGQERVFLSLNQWNTQEQMVLRVFLTMSKRYLMLRRQMEGKLRQYQQTVTRKHLSRQCLMYLRWRLRQPMNFRIRIWQLSIIMKSRPCM